MSRKSHSLPKTQRSVESLPFHIPRSKSSSAAGRRTGAGRDARVGTGVALAGTALLLVAELASIPVAAQRLDSIGAGLVGALFGVATLLSAIGFLIAGVATLRARRWQDWRRFTPLATGIWLLVLIGLQTAAALAAGVGVYGLCLLALGVALRTDPTPRPTSPAVHA